MQSAHRSSGTIRESLKSQLHTLVSVERSMLETWLKVQESNAESLANDQHVRETAGQLLNESPPTDGQPEAVAQTPPATAPTPAALRAKLTQELASGMSSHQFASYFLADRNQRIVASSNVEARRSNDREVRGVSLALSRRANDRQRRFRASCA